MPNCRECDSSEFNLVNGFYFCQVCFTQSQEIIEEEMEEVTGRTLVQKKEEKQANDILKPWYIVEGFQEILKAQTKALIKAGCKPQLEKVVSQIWFSYIHKAGILKIDNKLPVDKDINVSLDRFRDGSMTALLNKAKPEKLKRIKAANLAVRLKVSHRRRKILHSSESSDSDEDPIERKYQRKKRKKAAIQLSDEDWFTTDTSQSDDDAYFPSLTEKQLMMSSEQRRKRLKDVERFNYHSIEYLQISKLLYMNYIALQWCKETITISDLLTWVKQGYFPYMDSLKFLLPHMHLISRDSIRLSSTTVPTYEMAVKITEKLIEFVGFKNFPDVPIKSLVKKYILQLNLPISIYNFAFKLLKKISFEYCRSHIKKTCRLWECYAPELVAMSLVVLVMKILFGLNDKTEWEHGNDEPCKVHLNETCRIFSWKRWMNYHQNKRNRLRKNPNTIFDVKDCRSVDKVIKLSTHFESVLNVSLRIPRDARIIQSAISRTVVEGTEAKKKFFSDFEDLKTLEESIKYEELLRYEPFEEFSSEEDLTDYCVDYITSKQNFEYTIYPVESARKENCLVRNYTSFGVQGKCSSVNYNARFGVGTFHESYLFMINLGAKILHCRPRGVHLVVQSLERDIIPKLNNNFPFDPEVSDNTFSTPQFQL